jgi:zeaxanthin glucosyltransferase
MTRILFVVIPEKGHLNPYIGVAQKLRQRGCEVAFHAAHDISDQLGAAGLDGFLGEFTKGPPPDHNRGALFAEKVRDRQWLRTWIRELLVDNVPRQVARLNAIVKEFQPSLIVTDPMVYQAAIVAEQNKCAWVAISNSLNPVLNDEIESDLLTTVKTLDGPRRALFARYGLDIDCRGCDMISPHLTIAFTTEEFVGYGVPGVELVGPSIPSGPRGDETFFDWSRVSKKMSIIYMSLGSQIYYQPVMFRTVFEAVRDKTVQLIATVNELMHTNVLGEIPPNVVLSYYTPQLQILPKAAAMITHGGANSVMEAIYCDVPLLISPICNDQFHQAHFIAKQEIGIDLNLQDCSPQECWSALEKVISPGTIRDNMHTMSMSYRIDGAANAARLIENLAGK